MNIDLMITFIVINPVMRMSWMDSLWEADCVKDAKEFILKLVCLCSKIKHDVGLICSSDA
jgi:hypothetical protein